MLSMEKMRLLDQTVLIREDFNVPMKGTKISHTARIDAALPTIRQALSMGAKVILMSHLGRPKEGKFDAAFSLAPIAEYLSDCLQQKVSLFTLADGVPDIQSGQVAMLENVRFLEGEEANSPVLAKKLASLCNIFVMDAFAVAHRAQASTHGVAEFAKVACAGPLLEKEIQAIQRVLEHPQRPVLAIVGGSKVSTKLNVLTHLLDKVDVLVLGGGIANTFLAAKGLPIGDSLFEADFVETASAILEKAQKMGKTIWIPQDVVVAKTLEDSPVVKACKEVSDSDKIFDIGPLSQKELSSHIQAAKTILWNGPVGVFEVNAFAKGTESLAHAIANSTAYSVAGGGDTLAAIEQFNVANKISYLSTGGGAFLEVIEGKTLPAIAILQTRSKEKAVSI